MAQVPARVVREWKGVLRGLRGLRAMGTYQMV